MSAEKNCEVDETLNKVPPLKIKITPMPQTQTESFKSLFTAYAEGLVKCEPGGYVMTPFYAENIDKTYNIKPRKDDVWLLGFPKCGTTWSSEMLWLLMNNCDFDTAAKVPLLLRSIFTDGNYISSKEEMEKMAEAFKEYLTSSEKIEKMPSPRKFRVHTPLCLLHPQLLDTAKVVFVARNPKDCIVSYYHHSKLMIKLHGYQGTLEEFAEFFMNDELLFSPYFPNVLDAWSKRHHPNMHFMFYEDMKKDLKGELVKLMQFLEKSYTEEQLDKLVQHLRFQNFEKNESVNMEFFRQDDYMKEDGKFIRKGKTGDWKNHFGPDLNKKIDDWIAKNLEGSDLKFVTEIENQD